MFLRGGPIDLAWFDDHDFWSKVDTRSDAECWPWQRAIGTHGYGMVWDGSTMRVAHRVAWTLSHREQVPTDMVLDHTCRNQTCVNPSHLRPLTNSENGRLNGASQRTHCPAGHPYSGTNLYVNPTTGHRSCVACQRRNRLKQAA